MFEEAIQNNGFYKDQPELSLFFSLGNFLIYLAHKPKALVYKITSRRWCSCLQNFGERGLSPMKFFVLGLKEKQQMSFFITFFWKIESTRFRKPLLYFFLLLLFQIFPTKSRQFGLALSTDRQYIHNPNRDTESHVLIFTCVETNNIHADYI